MLEHLREVEDLRTVGGWQAPEERAWKCCRCMGVGALGASATEAEELEQGRKEGLAVASSIAAVLSCAAAREEGASWSGVLP